jgi:hypothetical protein
MYSIYLISLNEKSLIRLDKRKNREGEIIKLNKVKFVVV